MTTTIQPTAVAPASTPSPRSGVCAAPIPEALVVLAARLAVTLEASVTRFLSAGTEQNLGHLETQVAHDAQELLRTATQRAAQAKADRHPAALPRLRPAAHPLLPRSRPHFRGPLRRHHD